MRQQFGRCCGKDKQPSSNSTGILMVVPSGLWPAASVSIISSMQVQARVPCSKSCASCEVFLLQLLLPLLLGGVMLGE